MAEGASSLVLSLLPLALILLCMTSPQALANGREVQKVIMYAFDLITTFFRPDKLMVLQDSRKAKTLRSEDPLSDTFHQWSNEARDVRVLYSFLDEAVRNHSEARTLRSGSMGLQGGLPAIAERSSMGHERPKESSVGSSGARRDYRQDRRR